MQRINDSGHQRQLLAANCYLPPYSVGFSRNTAAEVSELTGE